VGLKADSPNVARRALRDEIDDRWRASYSHQKLSSDEFGAWWALSLSGVRSFGSVQFT
jgi:hypothetical protein